LFANDIKKFLRQLITLSAIFLSTFSIAKNSLAQSGGTFDFTAKKRTHTARILFMVVRFNSGKHRTVIRRDGQTIVDGRQAFGTDGNVPTREISSIKLFIDRKEIEVSKRTYAD